MELTSIPHEPYVEQAAVIEVLLVDDGVCRGCGTWVCSDCGILSSFRSRFSTEQQLCRTCKSPHGRMAATRHRPGRDLDHFAVFLRLSVEGLEPRYPVGTPLPAAAVVLIERLRARR